MLDKPPTPFWLARWAKKEAFWEAVAVQTVGTIGAALLIAIFASIVGAGDYAPAVRFYTSVAIITVVGLGGLIAIAGVLGRLAMRRRRYPERLILSVVGIIVMSLLSWLFFQYIMVGRLMPALASWYGFPLT